MALCLLPAGGLVRVNLSLVAHSGGIMDCPLTPKTLVDTLIARVLLSIDATREKIKALSSKLQHVGIYDKIEGFSLLSC